MTNIVGIVFILIGFICIKGCGLIDTEKIKGEVTYVIRDVRQGSSRLGGRLDQPYINFEYEGSLYTLTKYEVTFVNTYSEGDDAYVYFPINKPEEAQPYGVVAYWLAIPGLCITGFLCILWLGISNIINGKVKGYR